MKFHCDTVEGLLAALSYRKGASHDCSSTTDDRGHAGAESVAAYASIVSPTGFAVRTLLPHVARCFDPRAHSDLSDLPYKREEAGHQLDTYGCAALRFLYRVTLKKEWTFGEEIPLPKKPQKLPVVLSPEEVVHFLGCVDRGKHRVILTTCYAAGLGISEVVRLKAAAVDSARMVIRVDQGKGRKCCTEHLRPYVFQKLM
jgi:integrase